jgi:hypothetical protein
VTTDALVTRQRGDGIYAGLPWFNEYWGRDTFIALPGALLVTGRFAEARAVLTSFARFQDLDRASRFYGRLPNIVKPGQRRLPHHRRHAALGARAARLRALHRRPLGRRRAVPQRGREHRGLARALDRLGRLPRARRQRDVDGRPARARQGGLRPARHARQRRAGALVRPAPRRRRVRGAHRHAADAARWTRAADRLRARFARDFVDPRTGRVADHLDARGAADYTLRPNLLFALDLVPDPLVAARAARRAWEGLVYPWGTSTLDAADPNFHPYHLAWEHYHKDAAYHNGTVWPWLDGIAMQRMVERGQPDVAWPLFRRTATMALTRGAVGGLPETMDAYPHPGEAAPRLTGTFLQAWSNAEYLRVWSEQFLGVRPDLGPRGRGARAADAGRARGRGVRRARGRRPAARAVRPAGRRAALRLPAHRPGGRAHPRPRALRRAHVRRRPGRLARGRGAGGRACTRARGAHGGGAGVARCSPPRPSAGPRRPRSTGCSPAPGSRRRGRRPSTRSCGRRTGAEPPDQNPAAAARSRAPRRRR